jgi:hypothetical protein
MLLLRLLLLHLLLVLRVLLLLERIMVASVPSRQHSAVAALAADHYCGYCC